MKTIQKPRYKVNSNLLGAAPDLLAALETFVRKYNDAGPDEKLGIGLINDDFFIARAAIAKAYGEKP
jgi:hypothetical protein